MVYMLLSTLFKIYHGFSVQMTKTAASVSRQQLNGRYDVPATLAMAGSNFYHFKVFGLTKTWIETVSPTRSRGSTSQKEDISKTLPNLYYHEVSIYNNLRG